MCIVDHEHSISIHEFINASSTPPLVQIQYMAERFGTGVYYNTLIPWRSGVGLQNAASLLTLASKLTKRFHDFSNVADHQVWRHEPSLPGT
jgi:uncharacterized protein YigE (DUF2233 family)